MTPQTKLLMTGDAGEETVLTFAEFLADNADLLEPGDVLRLDFGETINIGGGASPTWTLQTLPDGYGTPETKGNTP